VLAPAGAVFERDEVDLDHSLRVGIILRWHEGNSTRYVVEMLRPHIHEIGEILNAANIGLGLEAVLQGRTRSFQRRLQPFGDDVMYLATERSLAAPIASRRDIDLGVKGAVGAKRHIAGDEDKIARRHRGIVAGSRERLARQSELVDGITFSGNDSNQ
jgi:hypothetical protein